MDLLSLVLKETGKKKLNKNKRLASSPLLQYLRLRSVADDLRIKVPGHKVFETQVSLQPRQQKGVHNTPQAAEERLLELIQNKCLSSWRVGGGWGGETPSFSICVERLSTLRQKCLQLLLREDGASYSPFRGFSC